MIFIQSSICTNYNAGLWLAHSVSIVPKYGFQSIPIRIYTQSAHHSITLLTEANYLASGYWLGHILDLFLRCLSFIHCSLKLQNSWDNLLIACWCSICPAKCSNTTWHDSTSRWKSSEEILNHAASINVHNFENVGGGGFVHKLISRVCPINVR